MVGRVEGELQGVEDLIIMMTPPIFINTKAPWDFHPKGPDTSYDLNLTPMPLPHGQTSRVTYPTLIEQGKYSYW